MHELPTRLWQLHTSLDDIAAALDYERMLFFTIVSTRAYMKIAYKINETNQYLKLRHHHQYERPTFTFQKLLR